MNDVPIVGAAAEGYFVPGNPYFVQTVGSTATRIQPDGLMEYEILCVLERTEVVDGDGRWYGRIVRVEHRKAPRHRLPPHLR